MNHLETLKAHILDLSEASDFDLARLEWKLAGVELQDSMCQCPCGQSIKELCFIKNSVTGHTTFVGNVCVNMFLGIQTGNLFDGLKRITKDQKANANEDLIIHAYELGFIFDREFVFLMETRLKRRLSPTQLAWKEKINRRIVSQAKVSGKRSLLEDGLDEPGREKTDPKTKAKILRFKQGYVFYLGDKAREAGRSMSDVPTGDSEHQMRMWLWGFRREKRLSQVNRTAGEWYKLSDDRYFQWCQLAIEKAQGTNASAGPGPDCFRREDKWLWEMLRLEAMTPIENWGDVSKKVAEKFA